MIQQSLEEIPAINSINKNQQHPLITLSGCNNVINSINFAPNITAELLLNKPNPNEILLPLPFLPTLSSTNILRQNILNIFIEEEMRIAERRRLLFCERQLGSLLGSSKACVF